MASNDPNAQAPTPDPPTSTLSVESLCLSGDECPPTDQPQDSENEHDTDLDLDSGEEELSEEMEVSTAEIYLQACRMVGVVLPCLSDVQNPDSITTTLVHEGLGLLRCKALAITLVANLHINTLVLANNQIKAEGVKYLKKAFKANSTIQHLDLSYNNLQSAGAEIVGDMLLENTTLKSLKLSGNGFLGDDAKYFSKALSSNSRLKGLDLSRNKFSFKGGEHLGQLLANNDGLEVLDIHWTELTMDGVAALCAGLKENVTLKYLNLAWNALGNEGAHAAGDALKVNSSLVYLNLGHSHITNKGISLLCKGLEFNDTLRVLQLEYNPITLEAARALLDVVKKTCLEKINVYDVLATEDFVQLLKETQKDCPGLDFQYGLVEGFLHKKPPPPPPRPPPPHVDLMKIIRVEAVTPRSTMGVSSAGARADSGGLQPFSANPLISWHHTAKTRAREAKMKELKTAKSTWKKT